MTKSYKEDIDHDAAFVSKPAAPVLKETDANLERQVVDELPPLYPNTPPEVSAG